MLENLNAWMRQMGYQWVEGQERMYKSMLTWVEATQLLVQLEQEGAVRRG